jgi:hypothetical protein
LTPTRGCACVCACVCVHTQDVGEGLGTRRLVGQIFFHEPIRTRAGQQQPGNVRFVGLAFNCKAVACAQRGRLVMILFPLGAGPAHVVVVGQVCPEPAPTPPRDLGGRLRLFPAPMARLGVRATHKGLGGVVARPVEQDASTPEDPTGLAQPNSGVDATYTCTSQAIVLKMSTICRTILILSTK